ncbi:hypothetical protein BSZ19_00855 [Bradyrhizobium japonicum]|uniref:Uncharacterized protein n=1 Tax=Bradyrhizobium japonicum TaxID=375 RepID=A0A1Y2JZ46_BRAJP|nr:hypothetical protein BSZ19_00855 [Bradyrhizobium japonicum]
MALRNLANQRQILGVQDARGRRGKCSAQPKLVHNMMDSARGLTVRVFECQCGERTWTKDQE